MQPFPSRQAPGTGVRPAALGVAVMLTAFLTVASHALTDTLDAVSGTGTNNTWNTGGVNVGLDCSAPGATAAYTTKKGNNLHVPLTDTRDPHGAISNVRIRLLAKANVSLIGRGEGIRIRIRTTVAENEAAQTELTASYAYYEADFPTDPGTGAAWSWSAIDYLQAGARSTASGSQNWSRIDVDHVQAIVFYNRAPVLQDTLGNHFLDTSCALQRTDLSGIVEVSYRLADPDDATATITVAYWSGAAWTNCQSSYLAGDWNSVDASNPAALHQVRWNAKGQLGAAIESNTYNIRLIASDAGGNRDTIHMPANSLRIDTRAPTGVACSAPPNGSPPGSGTVPLTSTPGSDLSVISYQFQIDDNSRFSSPDSSPWQAANYDWTAVGLQTGRTYYWRVRARDAYLNSGAFSTAYNFTVSSVKPCVVIDTAFQANDGSGRVSVQYDLADPQAPEACRLFIQHSVDGGSTWRQSYILSATVGTVNNTGVSGGTSTGQISAIATNQSNAAFVWDSKNSGNQGGSLNNLEYANARIRITPTDAAANAGVATLSLNFAVDNRSPTGVASITPANGATNVTLTPTLYALKGSDLSATQYLFQLDDDATFTTPVQWTSWRNDTTWSPPIQLNPGATYYWHVKAQDVFGNLGAYAPTFQFTTSQARWLYPTSGVIGACSAPAVGEGVIYVGTGGSDDKVYALDAANGQLKWSYQASGDVYNVICYYYDNPGKYAVYFTCSNATLNALWDNGSSAAAKFTAVDLGTAAISEPMISPDGNYLYFEYNNAGYKRLASNGATAWNTASLSLSPTSAAIVDNDNVFFASSGATYKYTIDNTPQGSVGHGTSFALGMWDGVAYIPAGGNFMYAVNTSTMTDRWSSANLGAATGSGAFKTGSGVLVAAGNTLKVINQATGAVSGSYTAGGTIQSMPVPNTLGSCYFFGANDSRAYAVVAADLSAADGWPKQLGGPVQATPAVDVVSNIVVFCTTEGKVYAYDLP
jgi:hypothetical protein